jgi:galactose-1-phosphate uridylyltransferase
MKFEAKAKETVLLNPLEDMARRSIPSQIRLDPLTGRTARVCHFMNPKWVKPDFSKIVDGTEVFCPFCPDKVMKLTPCFPEELIPEGRMVSEDRVLFPNLAPYDSISALVTFGARHYVPMTEFKPDRIAGTFRLACDFFTRLRDLKHPEAVYNLVNWNYMPASGSSLIHPHLQVFATSTAPNLLREELEAAGNYFKAHQSNYWDDLVKAEEEVGERWLGRLGRTAWMSSYAPLGVVGDVLAVVEGVTHTLELTDQDLLNLAQGLTKVMAAYDQMGIYNFNMNFFSGVPGEDQARFHLLFSARTFFNQSLGTPDVAAIRNLYNESICITFPEEINKLIKPEFEGQGKDAAHG